MFPDDLRWLLAGWINRWVGWRVANHGDTFEVAANGVLFVLVHLETFLRGLTLVAGGVALPPPPAMLVAEPR